jgi:hypothetical protein
MAKKLQLVDQDVDPVLPPLGGRAALQTSVDDERGSPARPRGRAKGATDATTRRRTSRTPRASASTHADALAVDVGPFPYADDERTQLAMRCTPRLWERLEDLAEALRDEGNRQASVSALVVAVLAFRAPADAAAAVELARKFVADGEDTATVERNVRVYEAQRGVLDRYARALSQAGMPGRRSRIVNAIIHAYAPRSTADAAQLLRAFDLWRAGVLEPDAAVAARAQSAVDATDAAAGEGEPAAVGAPAA